MDKYVYVIVKRRHDSSIRVSYTQTETVNNLDDLQHDLIREAMRLTEVTKGVEIITMADVPGHGSGLGSSSAVTVGVLNALSAYNQRSLHEPYKLYDKSLAESAIKVECDKLKQTPGHQDQYAVACGGLNLIEFSLDEPMIQSVLYHLGHPPGHWQSNLLLFSVPTVARDSKLILTDQESRNGDNLRALEAMKQLVWNAIVGLKDRQFDVLGPLLDSAWILKKSLSPHISTPIIDQMYEAGRQAGATGGKVCGAGGAGYMLFYCPSGSHDTVRAAMASYGPELEFNFEWEGSVCKQLY
jgi:D-glycero-alpha-D-manno-heptose-7-phosphate kinase